MSILKNTTFRLLSIVFAIYTLAWLYLNLINPWNESFNNAFTDSYGIIAGIGGIAGFSIAKKWGGIKSVVGRSLLAFSTGLTFNFLGQVSYAIYFYVYKVENPYPSFGEIFYFGSIPIYIIGAWLLAAASGSKLSLASYRSKKIVSILLPISMMLLSYSVFLKSYEFDWTQPILIFLDFGYPLGQAISVSLAILTFYLSKGTLGGIMKSSVLLIVTALIIQYVSDTTFLYQTFQDAWEPAGTSDLLFTISYFLMSLAILQFGEVVDKIGAGKKLKCTQN